MIEWDRVEGIRVGCMGERGTHCNGNSVYIFLFWELRGLSPKFHIHVSVSDLYIPRIGPHISSRRKGRPIVGIYISNFQFQSFNFRHFVFAVQDAKHGGRVSGWDRERGLGRGRGGQAGMYGGGGGREEIRMG